MFRLQSEALLRTVNTSTSTVSQAIVNCIIQCGCISYNIYHYVFLKHKYMLYSGCSAVSHDAIIVYHNTTNTPRIARSGKRPKGGIQPLFISSLTQLSRQCLSPTIIGPGRADPKPTACQARTVRLNPDPLFVGPSQAG